MTSSLKPYSALVNTVRLIRRNPFILAFTPLILRFLFYQGVVYLGRFQGTRRVAIKQMKDWDGSPDSDEQRQEFIGELETLKKMPQHPNLVAFLGWCSQPLSVVQEFIPGGDWETRLARQAHEGAPFRLVEVLDAGAQIALALEHIHKNGVVHR
jgi:eukaryotic-like serine/threonine-protein kinase